MAMEDLNVANLLETKSNRAAPTESVPRSNARSNADAAATKCLEAVLIGMLASLVLFVIITMGIAGKKN
jgi:hypothetical protein